MSSISIITAAAKMPKNDNDLKILIMHSHFDCTVTKTLLVLLMNSIHTLALTKARSHNMLTGDRPNFVTMFTLVRDATARLPNGEGTRADLCELLKSSQYINSQAPDSILQTMASGALDRKHIGHDPCVRHVPKEGSGYIFTSRPNRRRILKASSAVSRSWQTQTANKSKSQNKILKTHRIEFIVN